MKNLTLLSAFVAFFWLSGCTDYDALDKSEYERETKEMTDAVQGRPLNLYKGIKMAIRSLPISVEMDSLDLSKPATDAAKDKLLNNSSLQKMVLRLLGKDVGESSVSETAVSIVEWIGVLRGMTAMEDEIKGMKEDEFPTILHTLATIEYIIDSEMPHPKDVSWTATHEHLLLAVLEEELKFVPPAVKTYELLQTDLSTLDNDGIKPLCHMLKGVLLIDETWGYHAEEQFSAAITLTTDNAVTITNTYSKVLFPGSELTSTEGQLAEMQAMAYLLRSYSRFAMKAPHKQEQAAEDVETFLAIADRLGIDNELSWAASCMYYIQKEDHVKSLVYLNKLRASSHLNAEEKLVLKKVEVYISERNKNAALNVFYDNFFIGDLALSYLHDYLANVTWYREIIETEFGSDLLGFPHKIDDLFEKVDQVKGVQEDIEGVAGDLQEKGKALLDELGW
jgi:hypothetical protein